MLSRSVSVFSDGSLQITRPGVITPPRYRVAWDDEVSDWNYKSRTTSPEWTGPDHPDNPPAVFRFAPYVLPAGQTIGDYRVNLEKEPAWQWDDTCLALLGGDVQKFNYWKASGTAQFNTTGWARMAYLLMSGNEIKVLERLGGWVKFATLKPTDWLQARSMSHAADPCFIHNFTCVTWARNEITGEFYTKHIHSTGTPRGFVHYPVVTWLGYGWIPARYVVPL